MSEDIIKCRTCGNTVDNPSPRQRAAHMQRRAVFCCEECRVAQVVYGNCDHCGKRYRMSKNQVQRKASGKKTFHNVSCSSAYFAAQRRAAKESGHGATPKINRLLTSCPFASGAIPAYARQGMML